MEYDFAVGDKRGSYEEARKHFMKAQDDKVAQYYIGRLIYEDVRFWDIVPSDEELISIGDEAAAWFARSAEQGYVPAMIALGDILREQDGEEAFREAVGWYSKASDLGCADAAYEAGRACIRQAGLDYELSNASIVAASSEDIPEPEATALEGSDECRALLAEAFKWFLKADGLGSKKAPFMLGLLCATGMGTEKSTGEARRWFEKSGESGDRPMDCWMGRMYEEGSFGETSLEKAAEHYRRAAGRDIPDAVEALIRLYDEGSCPGGSPEELAGLREKKEALDSDTDW